MMLSCHASLSGCMADMMYAVYYKKECMYVYYYTTEEDSS